MFHTIITIPLTENRSQIVTDTWRQEFNIKNGKPIPKAKTYAHIIYDDNNKLKKIDLLTYS
jgi:hypothetical protein